jgi:hypothetical protein
VFFKLTFCPPCLQIIVNTEFLCLCRGGLCGLVFLFSEASDIFNFHFVWLGKVVALLQAFIFACAACKCSYTFADCFNHLN